MFGRLRRKEKTEESTQKTGAAWKRALGGLFRRGGIDDDFWEQLEEALIISDVGVQTSLEIVEQLRDLASDNGWKETDQVREALELPETFAALCLIPVGYPLGNFGPVRRRPLSEVMRFDRWS